MRVLVPLVTTVLAAIAGCAGDDPRAEPAPRGPDSAEVVRVVDGDTVIVRDAEGESTIRLLGIDTPESVKPDSPVECFGPEASDRAKELLPRGAGVRIETDASQDRIDDFGRTLAYVFSEGDDRSVNEQLVDEGFARVFISRGEPFRLEPRFTDLEESARDAGRGLWGACQLAGDISDGISPNGRDCPNDHPIKGNLPSRVYHQDGDPDYGNVNPERCFTNAASAEADGFRAPANRP